MKSVKKPLEVYVYIVEMRGGDPFGHVGLILQQKNGTYIRYSQAAANPNLHGFDRWQSARGGATGGRGSATLGY